MQVYKKNDRNAEFLSVYQNLHDFQYRVTVDEVVFFGGSRIFCIDKGLILGIFIVDEWSWMVLNGLEWS